MDDARLPTAVWVDAHLRRLNEKGQGHYVAHKGAYSSGMVLLKINLLNGFCDVLVQTRGFEGVLGWMRAVGDAAVAETDADAYIARAVERDPDLWVIEIEDRNGANPFEGKLILE